MIGKLVGGALLLAVGGNGVAMAQGEQAALRQELDELRQRYEAQQNALMVLERRLRQLEARPPLAARQTPGSGSTGLIASAAPPPAQSSGGYGVGLRDDSDQSPSTEALYQEASGFFGGGGFSLEPGLTYTYYDTRQLFLNGFLALDSIFLGNLGIDQINAHTWTFDLTGRYNWGGRWQFDANLPFITRNTTYESAGAGGSTAVFSDATVRAGPRLGDVSFGLSYKFMDETPSRPDMVASLRVKAPTGKDPYGIKVEQTSGNTNLSVPDDLPTGNGVWSITPGVSLIKTIDPVVLFANASYTFHKTESFSDISPQADARVPGKVKQGNYLQLGVGMAFALNERMSLSMSFSQLVSRHSRIKPDGGSWQKVDGSNANAAYFNLGMTYALTDRLTMVPNLSIGLTPDATNFSLSVKFPYYF